MHLTWEQALAWRMRRHFLLERTTPTNMVDVVDRLCGVHAQLMSSVELALFARIDGLTRDALADALWRTCTLVKVWAMRGTLHVLPARDLGTWVAGLRIWKPGGWPLKEPEAIEAAKYIDRALRGRVLTRAELAAAIGGLGATPKMVKAMLGSWSASLRYASFFGSLCFAAGDGSEARFSHPATWLRRAPARVDAERAFDELTTRYLRAYGPATPRDLGPRWWGINQTLAKRRLAALGDAATVVTIDRAQYWMLAEDVDELAAATPVDVVRLLPAFDQWVVCASQRVAAFVDPKYRPRIYRQQGWVSPVVLENGRMVGTWKHEVKGSTVRVDVEPFGKISRRGLRSIAAEAERLAAFFGARLTLQIHR